MLSAIRSLARSPIIGGAIVILLIAAFALFGITDIFRGTGDAAVLVGSERVTVRELGQAYQRQIQQIQRQNPRFTTEQAEQLGLGNQLVRILTSQAALDAKTKELGMSLSDQQLLDSLSSIQAFRNAFSGEFDRAAYQQVLAENNYHGQSGARLFEAEFSAELVRNQLLDALDSGFQPPQIMLDARQAYTEEQRTIRALLLPPSLSEDVGEPDDETLAAFIEENASVFMRPERRSFTLVRVTPDAFSLDVNVSEEDVQDLYEYQRDTGALTDPATRSFTQWAFDDEVAANQALAALANDASDDTLGQPLSFSDVEAFEVPDNAVADAVFDMSVGETGVVEGLLGWRVVRIDGGFDPEMPTLEALRSELVSELAADQAEADMLDALARFEEARASGQTLEEAAMSAGVPAEKFGLVSQTTADTYGYRLATLADQEDIMTAVFELPQGFAGDLTSYNENGYFVARVDAIETPRLPEVDEVREDASAFWRLRTVDEALGVIANAALARAEAGEDFNDIANELGENASVEITTVGRGETAGIFNSQLVNSAFTVVQDRPFLARAGDQRTRAVVMVTEVTSPSNPAAASTFAEAMSTEFSDDVVVSFERGLLSSYSISEDPRLIDLALGRADPNTP